MSKSVSLKTIPADASPALRALLKHEHFGFGDVQLVPLAKAQRKMLNNSTHLMVTGTSAPIMVGVLPVEMLGGNYRYDVTLVIRNPDGTEIMLEEIDFEHREEGSEEKFLEDTLRKLYDEIRHADAESVAVVVTDKIEGSESYEMGVYDISHFVSDLHCRRLGLVECSICIGDTMYSFYVPQSSVSRAHDELHAVATKFEHK